MTNASPTAASAETDAEFLERMARKDSLGPFNLEAGEQDRLIALARSAATPPSSGDEISTQMDGTRINMRTGEPVSSAASPLSEGEAFKAGLMREPTAEMLNEGGAVIYLNAGGGMKNTSVARLVWVAMLNAMPRAEAASEPSRDARVEWRVGQHYGIHVYAGETPIATFVGSTDFAEANARAAVAAYNAAPQPAPVDAVAIVQRLLGRYRAVDAPVDARAALADAISALKGGAT